MKRFGKADYESLIERPLAFTNARWNAWEYSLPPSTNTWHERLYLKHVRTRSFMNIVVQDQQWWLAEDDLLRKDAFRVSLVRASYERTEEVETLICRVHNRYLRKKDVYSTACYHDPRYQFHGDLAAMCWPCKG